MKRSRKRSRKWWCAALRRLVYRPLWGWRSAPSQSVGTSVADLEDDFSYMCEVMSKTRPTAVNLFWAIERMREAFHREKARTQEHGGD